MIIQFHHWRKKLKNKASARASRWNKENREKRSERMKDWRLRRFYGITLEDREELHKTQSGKCAISSCKRDAEHIDHCHETGKVRGLLCKICNMMLGAAEDNPQILRDAAEYLEQAKLKELKGGTKLPKQKRVWTKESRAKLSESLTGNKRGFKKGFVPWNKGRRWTEKQRISAIEGAKKRIATIESLPDSKARIMAGGIRGVTKRWGGE